MPVSEAALDEFLQRLEKSFQQGSLHKLSLGNYHGSNKSLKKISVKTVQVKGSTAFSFTFHHKTQDIIKNHPALAALEEVRTQLAAGFRAAYLQDAAGEAELKITASGKTQLHILSCESRETSLASHDREKNRLVNPAAPWLHALGITDHRARVVPSMSHKWKQINRFVEIFASALERAGLDKKDELRVVDFGSGKGYLTFAISDHINTAGIRSRVLGVELRENLVQLCNATAQQCGSTNLSFACGDIRHATRESCDVVIALHACDTATDLAIHYGVRANAAVILCAPCCHKEIRPQLQSPLVLRPLLRHGIHAGAEAEMLTDTLRALLLERENYDVRIMEFTSLEHTDKNRMLVAIQKSTVPSEAERQRIDNEIASLKNFYGIRQQALEELLSQAQ